jgi:ethanolamine utilization protein EutA (predicted chaperonin)
MVWDAAPVQELRFCGHHGRALNQALFDNGWVVDTNIYDLTGRAVV